MATKTCPAGHKMTAENTYHHHKHGNTYKECRECKRLQAKIRHRNRYTKKDQRVLSRQNVLEQDTTGITNCPKCKGILKWGEGSKYEDLVSCVYCGWRPTATVEVEL